MTATQAPPPPPVEIALRDLPERTKDFLIAYSARDKQPVTEVVREVLNRVADQANFVPAPPTTPNPAAA